MRRAPAILLVLVLGACRTSEPGARAVGVAVGDADAVADAHAVADAVAVADADAVAVADADAHAVADADGDDDPDPSSSPTLPAKLRVERVGRAPLALMRICDLTPFRGALYAAHAMMPLGTDGATISRYEPGAKVPFTVAFDWNRPGEPTKGGGAGQGFLRVHAIDGRLWVPDADPPYNGFGITEPGTEGFVFVSDAEGRFAKAREPHFRPPATPKDGGAGAALIPRAYHVLDAIRFRGHVIASTGAVPPKERAWHGPAPGALHVLSEDGTRFLYAIDHPRPYDGGTHRLGYMVRFRGKLFVGLQDYDGRDPNDYVVIAPPPGRDTLEQGDLRAVRATPKGTTLTLRWYADRGRLFWIGLDRDGSGHLRVTDDGETWREPPFPGYQGRFADIVRVGERLVVLTEKGLWELAEGTEAAADARPLVLWDKDTKDDKALQKEFEVNDAFCAPPLATFQGALYAGGQRWGTLFRFAPEP